MNVTIREAISQLRVPNKAVNSDSRLTNKYFYSILKKHRDYLIKEQQSKFRLMRLAYLFQRYRCVDLIPTNKVDECCGIKTNCKVYRTKKRIPKLMIASEGPVIRRVISIDGATEIYGITPMEWNRKQEDTNQKYDKTLYYFYHDGYLYFPNLQWKKIEVEGFFEEKIVNDCDDAPEDCVRFLDGPFQIPQDLLARCIDNANREIFDYYHRTGPDDNQPDKNNARKN